MSASNLGTLSTLVTSVAIAATAPMVQNREMTSSFSPMRYIAAAEQLNKSGYLIVNYPHSAESYFITQEAEKRINNETMRMQSRFQSMKRSFLRYNEGFPQEKQSYFAIMADALCKLDFEDNVSSYNQADASIDTVIKLKNGITLRVSCFIDDEIDAPMVFSIHRGRTLLVTDELPVSEIVNTIISVSA